MYSLKIMKTQIDVLIVNVIVLIVVDAIVNVKIAMDVIANLMTVNFVDFTYIIKKNVLFV